MTSTSARESCSRRRWVGSDTPQASSDTFDLSPSPSISLNVNASQKEQNWFIAFLFMFLYNVSMQWMTAQKTNHSSALSFANAKVLSNKWLNVLERPLALRPINAVPPVRFVNDTSSFHPQTSASEYVGFQGAGVNEHFVVRPPPCAPSRQQTHMIRAHDDAESCQCNERRSSLALQLVSSARFIARTRFDI